MTLRSTLKTLAVACIVSFTLGAGSVSAEESENEPLNNRLKWSTASEVDNFGYDVYRGDSEEGPFERITKDPMPGSGTTDEPSYYEFTDSEIDPSREYFYYVESIALDGSRERFTPIIRAKAKLPKERAPGTEGAAAASEEATTEEAPPEESDPEEPGSEEPGSEEPDA